MDTPRTPRMRSAFPETPRTDLRNRRSVPFARESPPVQQKPLPQIPTLRSQPTSYNNPFIPEHIVDAPSQRLYAVAFWVVLWTWRIYDFAGLQESEEQSLWLFMKWVAIDGVFLFGLPGLRIPWLEWSAATMTLIFLAHALADGMLMFRVPIPLGAGVAALGRGLWGAYEIAVNEHNVNPNTVTFNESLILGRQVIHILPEGSAILNPERSSFCLDGSRTEARLPIMINATSPIGIDILRVDLDTNVNETLHISKSQIKKMHQEASRMLSYSDNPNEPKTLYYSVKKPGLYALAKVLDESNLEVSRKRMAHTVVVPCPKAELVSSPKDRCRGELSDTALQVVGTPPMRVKYRRVVNKSVQEATFENIQPEDLISPLAKQDHTSLVVPNKVDTDWAKTRFVRVPISESLGISGRWAYAIDQIIDGFGNVVNYNRDKEDRERPSDKSLHLHDTFTVHERPTVVLDGCTPQRPLKIAKDNTADLPLRYGSTGGKAAMADATYRLDYLFSPEQGLAENGDHGLSPKRGTFPDQKGSQRPKIKEPGLYTIVGVSTEFCSGDVLEPASCLLQNPPEPKLVIQEKELFDKCAGSPIGLSVDLDLIGTPPFNVEYRMTRAGDKHHYNADELVQGHRGQLTLTPREAGQYTYEFISISDAVYKQQPLKDVRRLQQSVKPSASAKFTSTERRVTCIDQIAKFDVSLAGEGPFDFDYEVIHGGKRERFTRENVTSNTVGIETKPLKEGGDYTISLTSITDRLGCKEFLKDEAKISVRHQKPKVSFGPIDGRRDIEIKEGDKAQLPLRLAGEAPWAVTYTDSAGHAHRLKANQPNERLEVVHEGTYKLDDVSDSVCPGIVDEAAREFTVSFIPRPELRIPPSEIKDQKGNTLYKEDVCEGDEDALEVLFKGSPPYKLSYTQHVKPEHGAVAPKNKELRAALNVASLRMDTSQAGLYEYKFSKLTDGHYDHNSKSFSPLTIQQKVNSRPSVAFTNPGKTYSFCSVEQDGEEVIPITLHGQPPFELEVEIKHHGTIKPEIVHYPSIPHTHHNIRIPHSRLHLGKSAIALRRVSDARGCARIMDSTTPRVQISVHDAPTITPLETQVDYCVGERIHFGLSGVAPFKIFYTFNGVEKTANVGSGTTFRRLAEKPGTFAVVGLQDSASSCRASMNVTKQIHSLPSVRVSDGRDSYVDIHEGGEAEIRFDFGGEPPFEFTYTRSSNTEKGGKKHGKVLDMRSEVSEERSMRIWASEEGTYEVVSIKDAHCSYSKQGIDNLNVEGDKSRQKRLGY